MVDTLFSGLYLRLISKNYFCFDSRITADERGAYCQNRILHGHDFIKNLNGYKKEIEELNLNE